MKLPPNHVSPLWVDALIALGSTLVIILLCAIGAGVFDK